MNKLIVLCLVVLSTSAMATFKTDAGLSMIRTGGNTEVETYDAKIKSVKGWEKNSLTLGGHYTLGTSVEKDSAKASYNERVESARNWDGYARVDHLLSDKWDVFAQVQIEGNEFAGYKQRNNYDLGVKRVFIKDDKVNFFGEASARHTTEMTTARDEDGDDVFDYMKAVLYTEYNRKVSKTLSYKFWLQYVPNFTESEDYQINFEPSFNVTLTDTFSMSMAYTGRFDNERNEGIEHRLDWTHTTSLIAKF